MQNKTRNEDTFSDIPVIIIVHPALELDRTDFRSRRVRVLRLYAVLSNQYTTQGDLKVRRAPVAANQSTAPRSRAPSTAPSAPSLPICPRSASTDQAQRAQSLPLHNVTLNILIEVFYSFIHTHIVRAQRAPALSPTTHGSAAVVLALVWLLRRRLDGMRIRTGAVASGQRGSRRARRQPSLLSV